MNKLRAQCKREFQRDLKNFQVDDDEEEENKIDYTLIDILYSFIGETVDVLDILEKGENEMLHTFIKDSLNNYGKNKSLFKKYKLQNLINDMSKIPQLLESFKKFVKRKIVIQYLLKHLGKPVSELLPSYKESNRIVSKKILNSYKKHYKDFVDQDYEFIEGWFYKQKEIEDDIYILRNLDFDRDINDIPDNLIPEDILEGLVKPRFLTNFFRYGDIPINEDIADDYYDGEDFEKIICKAAIVKEILNTRGNDFVQKYLNKKKTQIISEAIRAEYKKILTRLFLKEKTVTISEPRDRLYNSQMLVSKIINDDDRIIYTNIHKNISSEKIFIPKDESHWKIILGILFDSLFSELDLTSTVSILDSTMIEKLPKHNKYVRPLINEFITNKLINITKELLKASNVKHSKINKSSWIDALYDVHLHEFQKIFKDTKELFAFPNVSRINFEEFQLLQTNDDSKIKSQMSSKFSNIDFIVDVFKEVNPENLIDFNKALIERQLNKSLVSKIVDDILFSHPKDLDVASLINHNIESSVKESNIEEINELEEFLWMKFKNDGEKYRKFFRVMAYIKDTKNRFDWVNHELSKSFNILYDFVERNLDVAVLMPEIYCEYNLTDEGLIRIESEIRNYLETGVENKHIVKKRNFLTSFGTLALCFRSVCDAIQITKSCPIGTKLTYMDTSYSISGGKMLCLKNDKLHLLKMDGALVSIPDFITVDSNVLKCYGDLTLYDDGILNYKGNRVSDTEFYNVFYHKGDTALALTKNQKWVVVNLSNNILKESLDILKAYVCGAVFCQTDSIYELENEEFKKLKPLNWFRNKNNLYYIKNGEIYDERNIKIITNANVVNGIVLSNVQTDVLDCIVTSSKIIYAEKYKQKIHYIS